MFWVHIAIAVFSSNLLGMKLNKTVLKGKKTQFQTCSVKLTTDYAMVISYKHHISNCSFEMKWSKAVNSGIILMMVNYFDKT